MSQFGSPRLEARFGGPWCSAGLAAAFVAGLLLAPAPATAGQALVLTEAGVPEVQEAGVALGQILTDKGEVAELREPLPGDDLGDLTPYDCVFDLRVSTPIPAQDAQRFSDYAVTGGGMLLLGEHGAFDFRNVTVTGLLNGLGGGVVTTSTFLTTNTLPIDIIEPTNPDHFLATECNVVTEVDYDGIANGQFLNTGNGTWVTGAPTSACAALWETGDLTNAPQARVASVLDINFMATGVKGTLDFEVTDRTIPTQNRAFVGNMVNYLCKLCCGSNMKARLPGTPHAPKSAASPASPCSPRSK